ncbi:MAG: class I SAM-dependent methyltransferase [Bacteroidetes bacterium]|nr:class I SAM-dependent methyltransferase [bacterium]NBP66431.1 class I SAM-dependent methyltransferase [Bacteroidota bacterium]
MTQKPPLYGTSLHYSGESGINYLTWQDSRGEINGYINARKFKRYDFSQSTVLDFGSGTGNLLNCLNAKCKIAIEVNIEAHPLITQRGIAAHASIESIPSESVDFVISNHALEHVPYPIQALREMRRTLRPGGQLLLVVPIDDWRTQKKYCSTDINHHLNTWTPLLLGNTLTEAGFQVEPNDISIFSHAWFPGYSNFYRMPGFDYICKIYSILRKRRQIFVRVQK